MEVLKKHLRELGLTQYEMDAYMTLLGRGTMSANECSAASGVPRPRCYDVLNALVEKGLVQMLPGRPVRYSPVPPEIGIERLYHRCKENAERELEMKRKSADFLISQLKMYFSSAENILSDTVNMIRYEKPVEGLINLIDLANDYFYLVSPCEKIINSKTEFYSALVNALRKEVKIKIIQPISGICNFEVYDSLCGLGLEIKHMISPPGFFAIADRNVVLNLFERANYIGTLKISDDLSHKTFLDYFSRIWENAESYSEMKNAYRTISIHDFDFSLDLPSNAKIYFFDIDTNFGFVEFHIPLHNILGFIRVAWIPVQNNPDPGSLLQEIAQKTGMGIIEIENSSQRRNYFEFEGKWFNYAHGAGMFRARLMYTDNRVYAIIIRTKNSLNTSPGRESIVSLEMIASTFRV